MNPKFFKWLIIGLTVISIVSIFYIWDFSRSRGLDFQLEAPPEILVGVPFDLKVNFSNNSGAILKDARLAVTLPEGAAFWGSPVSKNIENKNLGNIGESSLIQEQYSIVVFSTEAVSREFKVTINYAPSSLGARFDKSQSITIPVKASGISITMAAPDQIISGEPFDLVLNYQNVSDADFTDLELKIEYPAAFSSESSSLKPDLGDNVWFFGDLRKNSDGKLAIRGSLVGNAGDKFEFKTFIYRRFSGENYLVSQNNFPVTLASSPLSLSLSVNGNPNHIANPGETLNYNLSYVNGTDQPLRDVVIQSQLVGEMFELSMVQSQGFFRSSDNRIIWNSQNTPNLALLPAGSAGIVNFSVKVKDVYPIRRFSDKNFVLFANGQIESRPQNLFTKSRLETKVAGRIAVDTRAYFRDADSGILNEGPMPPKAGQKTNFTIHWQIKNFAADVSSVEVRGKLGNNVVMVGDPKSNSGFLPRLDALNNEVVWNIDKIQANQGVISNPIEAIFQIEALPEASQAGSYLPLIGPTFIKAIDDFTGQELNNNDAGINTALPDDPTIGQQGGVVQP